MTAKWERYNEPVRTTISRNLAISVVAGGVVAQFVGGWSRWPLLALVMAWPSFGGHFVEMFFLNWLRMRLPSGRVAQVTARLAVWFVVGIALGLAMALTTASLAYFPRDRWLAWWQAGLGFIGVELLAHMALLLRRRPNFYNGLG